MKTGIKVIVWLIAIAFTIALLVFPYFADAKDAVRFGGYTTLAGSLVGALVGAMGAYSIQARFSKNAKVEADRLAASKILFYLFQQINTIALIYRDHFYEHRRHPLRFLLIQPTHPFDIERFVFDVNTWSFMLETQESRQIMYDLHFAQEQYIEALRVWNYRSAYHDKEVQSKLSEQFPDDFYASVVQMREVMGQRIFISIVTSTDGAEVSLKRAFSKLTKSNAEFRAYVVKRFGSENFTKFDYPETWGLLEPDLPSPTPRYPGEANPYLDENKRAYKYAKVQHWVYKIKLINQSASS